MPYIIKATGQKPWAVGTLEEAQDIVHHAGATFTAASITESGGTVGPLPDGTLIEVERVALINLVGNALPVARGMATSQLLDAAPEIIAAFNARSN